MSNKNAAMAARQQRTLPYASSYGQPWESDDVAMVAEFAGTVDVEELALALGRTAYAVENVRQALREGRLVGGGHGRTKPAPVATCTCHGLQLLPTGACALD